MLTDSDLPVFIDLVALAEAVAARPGMNRVGSLVRRAMRLQSCEADLAEAYNCCEALGQIDADLVKGPPAAIAVLQVSALQRAVLLYERATAAGAKQGERGSVQIRDALSAQEKADHDTLVRIRHRTLAHVHVGDEIEGEAWHHSILLAMGLEEGWAPASATRRMYLHKETFARCLRQVPVARRIIAERFNETMGKLSDVLNDGGLPEELFRQFVIDPIVAFGSEEAARHVVNSRPQGRAAFIH